MVKNARADARAVLKRKRRNAIAIEALFLRDASACGAVPGADIYRYRFLAFQVKETSLFTLVVALAALLDAAPVVGHPPALKAPRRTQPSRFSVRRVRGLEAHEQGELAVRAQYVIRPLLRGHKSGEGLKISETNARRQV